MTRHIKLFLYLFVIFSINVNCKKANDNKLSVNEIIIKKDENKKQVIENKNYETWYFSSKNKSDKYKNVEILISKDSIKILNTDTNKFICKGEVMQSKKSISDYTLGQMSAENLKSELNNLFNSAISDSINVVENADSEISNKGCLFPFYEMFFIENELFIYDNEYLVFTKRNTLENNFSAEENFKVNKLPFDFNTYYNVCYENQKECDAKYPSYNLQEGKKILDFYGIEENPTFFFMLPRVYDLQPIILAYTETDVEGYYLIISKKHKVVSYLQIAEFDGKSIDDFVIAKNFSIELYSRKNSTDKKILKKTYRIQKDGNIK